MKKRIVLIAALLAIASLAACSSAADKPQTTDSADNQTKTQAPSAPPEVPADTALKIVDLTTGKGNEAKPGDTVSVNYTGWLFENGKRTTKFDSSIGQDPFEMTIGQTPVIPGWTKGVVGMKVGGKRELIIPPDMGYGERGAGGVIPPHATLDFEIELLKLSGGK